MSTWSGGYHTESPYFPGYYREQAPGHLALVAAFCGADAPSPSRPFHYLELGCGLGQTLCLLAAANPHATFHGLDFLPAHVVRARQLASAAGLQNVFFHEASFQDWVTSPPPGLPAFDFITAHGIYSWVSEEARSAVRALLRRHLATGGLSLVSYNCLPGHAATVPIQRILYDYCKQRPGNSEARVAEAAAYVSRINDLCQFKGIDEEALARVKMRVQQGRLSYLAHELLTQHWAPQFPQDVMAQMAEAKLDFLGDADLMHNAIEMLLNEEARALLAEANAPGLRQLVLDLFAARIFRKDVYVRGLTRLSTSRRAEAIGRQRLAQVTPTSRFNFRVRLPIGFGDLNEAAYRPMLASLEQAPRGAAELAAVAQGAGHSTSVLEIAGSLVGADLALPATGAEAGPERARRFARAYFDWSNLADRPGGSYVASGVGGGGVPVGTFDMLALVSLIDGASPTPAALAEHSWRLLSSRGDHLTWEGQPVTERQAGLGLLQENMERVLRECLPMWKVLRML